MEVTTRRLDEGLHGLTGGSSDAVREAAERAARHAQGIAELGAALHLLGDAYAHTRTRGQPVETQYQQPIGHAPADCMGMCMHVDNLGNDPQTAMRYAEHLWSVLAERASVSEHDRGQSPEVMDQMRAAFVQIISILTGTEDEAVQRSTARAVLERLGATPVDLEWHPEDHSAGTGEQACDSSGLCTFSDEERRFLDFADANQYQIDRAAAGLPDDGSSR
jgi:hypothetical protein